MVKKVEWSRRAHEDRKEILLYWSHRNKSKTYSAKLFALFQQAVNRVAEAFVKTAYKNVRMIVVREYLILFTEPNDHVLIVAV